MNFGLYEIIIFTIGAIFGGASYYFINRNKIKNMAANISKSEDIFLQNENLKNIINDFKIVEAKLQNEITNLKEKEKWIEKAETQLKDTFEILAIKALKNNSETLSDRNSEKLGELFKQIKGDWSTQNEKLKNLFEPLGKGLDKMEKQVNDLEKNREGAYKGLMEQISNLEKSQFRLENATVNLTQALKSSSTRGRWGEIQLRRIVEMAGLVNHVDFDEQASGADGRPDMIIRLPKEGIIPVDSKAPMKSYLESTESDSENVRKEKMIEHAKSVRNHMKNLSQKAYWEQFNDRTPEFVTMVIPYEGGLSAAFECDPNLLEDALKNKVLIVSPVTLLALLKAVSFGWMQLHLAENGRKIAEQGIQLYKRLYTFTEHLGKIGKNLKATVNSYNSSVGSLQSRIFPAAEKLKELGADNKSLPELNIIDDNIRTTEQ